MKIKEIIKQEGDEFNAIFECEFCGDLFEGYGYDEPDFYSYILPGTKCIECGRTSNNKYGPMGRNLVEGNLIK